MMSFKSLLVALTAATVVSAHSGLTGIVANGEWHSGYDPNIQYHSPATKVPAWTAGTYRLDGVVAKDYRSDPIICHNNATPGKAYATVAAGSELQLQWAKWPSSHRGPLITYIAPCSGDCTKVKKEDLRFVKIAQAGLIKGGNSVQQRWATDDLIDSNSTDIVTIPPTLKAGNYVIRNEVIALHAAGPYGGAQHYPQCLNIKVTGSGTAVPSGGIPATQFYKPHDKGLVYNIYTNIRSYPIPGPPLWVPLQQRVGRIFREQDPEQVWDL